MATLEVSCNNQSLKWVKDPEKICAGNINIDGITFSFCPLWDGFTKTAVFYKEGGEAFHILLNENNTCSIPPEVTDTNGLVYVGVFGNKGECRRTTEAISFYLNEGIITEGKPSEPTPDIYAQIITLCNEAVNIAKSVREDADNGAFKGDKGERGEKGERGHTPQKGVDYFTETEKAELVDDVFNVLKEMNAFDIVSFINNTKVTLRTGRIYFFESTGDTYKVQLYDQDGNVQSQIDAAMGGIILYPSSGLAKYISIKESPDSIGLTDLFNLSELFDKFAQITTFAVNTEKPDIYIETVDNHNFNCWEIAGNSRDLQIGTYAIKELIKDITAELSVSFIYPLEFDEYAVAIDGVEIERQSYGGTMRIATELLKAKNTQIVFYRNDEEVIRARVQPTILNCGMLYAIER